MARQRTPAVHAVRSARDRGAWETGARRARPGGHALGILAEIEQDLPQAVVGMSQTLRVGLALREARALLPEMPAPSGTSPAPDKTPKPHRTRKSSGGPPTWWHSARARA